VKRNRWRHPWQVIRLYGNGTFVVCCSHRWSWSADACASIRAVGLMFGPDRIIDYDYRRTPLIAGNPHQIGEH